jgi:hypothetical protein
MANTTVKIKPHTASILEPAVIAWCAYVTVAPEHNKIRVLRRGISNALKVFIPLGGHTLPISIVGVILAEKKAQKKAKKNITSETINNIIPYRRPS